MANPQRRLLVALGRLEWTSAPQLVPLGPHQIRRAAVPHPDPLDKALSLEFLREFGAMPHSQASSGWPQH
jgi:hypothetical protein